MKISQPSESPVAISSNAASLAAKSGPVVSVLANSGAGKSGSANGVAVTVSSLARSLEAGGSDSAADVDMAKVSAVRQSIANGSFTVNAGAIADRLLAGAQDMFPRSRV